MMEALTYISDILGTDDYDISTALHVLSLAYCPEPPADPTAEALLTVARVTHS